MRILQPVEKGMRMVRGQQLKLAIYCKQEEFAQWEKALLVYSPMHATPEVPLLQQLQCALADGVDLFVIVDNAVESDATLIQAIQAIREGDQGLQPALRIAFIASDARETPSYFFRILANFDVFDLISARVPNDNAKSVYVQLAEVLRHPKKYTDAVPFFSNSVANPLLFGLSEAQMLNETSRTQNRIAVAQIDQRRGGSTHTTFVMARALVLLGYRVAVFLQPRTWNNLRRVYPRARHSLPNGLVTLSGIDFYRNEGFAQINGYDYVLADFGCAAWIDLEPDEYALKMEESFSSAQVGVMTSVVSPFGDHSSFERVLKVWGRRGELQKLGGVKFAFFGIPNQEALDNWKTVAQELNAKAELYQLPYLPDPLHFDVKSQPDGRLPQALLDIMRPVLRKRDL